MESDRNSTATDRPSVEPPLPADPPNGADVRLASLEGEFEQPREVALETAEAQSPAPPAQDCVTPELASPAPATPSIARSGSGGRKDPLDEMPALRTATGASPTPPFQRTGHPVRDRLLAKAAESGYSRGHESSESPIEAVSAFSALSGAEEELEQLAAPRGKMLSEPFRVGSAVLSPTTTLVGVTLIGLAALVSLFLLLSEFAPRTNDAASGTMTQASHAAPITTSLVAAPAVSTAMPSPETSGEKPQGPWRIGVAAAGQRVIRGTIGKNAFLTAIQEAGLDKSQAYRVFGVLKEHKNLDRCRPKDEFVALINRADNRVLAFEYVVSPEEIYQAKETDNGKLVGKQLDLQVAKRQAQGSLSITSTFAQAVAAAGLQPSIGAVVNRALEGHTSVSQFKVGDRLRVVAQEVTVLGEFYRYAGIEALEYLPVDGSAIRVYFHPTKKRYYDAKGRAPGEGGWRRPVRTAPITSKFNPQRLHPILKKRMPHNGTDFGAPTGTPVYAASYGRITKLGNYGPNGNFIAIEHPNGYETGYSHLSRFEPGLKVGDQVKRAQAIGYIGSTGRSTGPHLHFSAKKNGAFIDPETLNLDALTVLPSNERAAFSSIREKYDVMLEGIPLAAGVTVSVPPEPTHAPVAPVAGGDVALAPAQAPANDGVQAPAPFADPRVEHAGEPSVGAVPVGAAFYLTDKELLQAQPAVDDGEVDE